MRDNKDFGLFVTTGSVQLGGTVPMDPSVSEKLESASSGCFGHLTASAPSALSLRSSDARSQLGRKCRVFFYAGRRRAIAANDW